MESEEKTKCGVPCAQIFIPEAERLNLREAKSSLSRAVSRESDSEKEWNYERGGETEKACCLAWAVEQMRTVERMRDRERRRVERKVKFFEIWVVLFVLICDCFVANLLDRIYSLSGWFLVCLEDNNVRFTKIFVFLVKKMCQIFVIPLKLFFFFFFAPTTPYFLKFWGLPFTWRP